MKKIFLIPVLAFIIILVQGCCPSPAPMSGEAFYSEFFLKFNRDSVFQVERTVFPLKEISSELGIEADTLLIDIEDWKHQRLMVDEKADGFLMVYDNHEKNEFNSNEVMIEVSAFMGQIYSRYYFERIDSLWYLTMLEH